LITDENDNHEDAFHGSWETDFEEGMKSILDVVRPDLTSPAKDETLPTFLFPYRGGVLCDNDTNSRGGRL
jgi:hypothetical protein